MLLQKPQVSGQGLSGTTVRRRLYFTEHYSRKLNIIEWSLKEHFEHELPQMAGCLALSESGKLILAMEDGIYMRNDDWTLRYSS